MPPPEYFRARYLRVKQERVEYGIQYLGGKCVRCDRTDNLEFDHIDRKTKLFELITGIQRKWADWKAELEKCQLLCTDCHIRKTMEESGKIPNGTLEGRPHGKVTTYNNGCRCSDCKAANAASKYEYNLNYRFGIV